MALIVTPGAADAEAFASVVEFNAYCLARGTANAYGPTLVENALRKGAGYLVNQYRDKWVGVRAALAQALPWPRVNGSRTIDGGFTYPLLDSDGFEIADDVVPVQIKNANIEAALLALTGVSMEPRLERGGQIQSIGKSVGPLRKDITYAAGAPVVDRFTVIEGLLRGLVTGNPGASVSNVCLVRS